MSEHTSQRGPTTEVGEHKSTKIDKIADEQVKILANESNTVGCQSGI